MVAVFSGCFTSSHVDHIARRELIVHERNEPGVTEDTVIDAFTTVQKFAEVSEPVRLDASAVLTLASAHSRSLQTDRDTLYEAILELFAERRRLGLTTDLDLRYGVGISNDGDEDQSVDLEISETFVTGAELALTGTSSSEFEPTGDNDRVERLFRTNGALTLSQPLLDGAGYEASHTRLIQSEHAVIYALRAFALQRQDFAIETLRSFYDLIAQQTALANIELNTEQSTFLRERSEAMFQVQMAPYIDVLRSQQQELAAESRLSSASSALETDKRRFVVQLGLPVGTPLELIGDIPALRPLAAEKDQCISVGLDHRMEIRTGEDRQRDAERALRVARRGLLPDLNVFGRMRYVSNPEEDFPGGDFQDELTAGITMEVPLDKRDQRDLVKAAEIQLAAAQREVDRRRADVNIDVIDSVNRLTNLKRSVEIEEKNNEIADKRVRNAVLRFRSGELSNRDVVEAENELLETRNRLIDAMLDHEIERLRLLRNMGLLEVDAEGQVIENIERTEAAVPIFAEPVAIKLPGQ